MTLSDQAKFLFGLTDIIPTEIIVDNPFAAAMYIVRSNLKVIATANNQQVGWWSKLTLTIRSKSVY